MASRNRYKNDWENYGILKKKKKETDLDILHIKSLIDEGKLSVAVHHLRKHSVGV